ncbi:type I toxin-antitoxin system SymE family toxin [Flintibacter muris]|uniref:type I toxin-antitoxin system SymE family toxin n=1 Tax=Flintibacter muris TaxID=2941327 RepID=UPI00203C47FE|nr:type I toxin-antitoxin system SymE family toxin [Flintibacter muris]
MTGPILPNVRIPGYVLEEAGLDPECKLICTAEQGRGEIRVIQADHRFDLTDLRPDLLELFRACGVCMNDLEDKLVQEAIVYGDGSETSSAHFENE